MKEIYGFKREHAMRNSTQKRMKNNFDLRKAVGWSVTLTSAVTCIYFKTLFRLKIYGIYKNTNRKRTWFQYSKIGWKWRKMWFQTWVRNEVFNTKTCEQIQPEKAFVGGGGYLWQVALSVGKYTCLSLPFILFYSILRYINEQYCAQQLHVTVPLQERLRLFSSVGRWLIKERAHRTGRIIDSLNSLFVDHF